MEDIKITFISSLLGVRRSNYEVMHIRNTQVEEDIAGTRSKIWWGWFGQPPSRKKVFVKSSRFRLRQINDVEVVKSISVRENKPYTER